MNNSMVAHLWAHEQEESASGSNFFFEGTSIYSYGHHFEVGRIVKNKQGKKAYLINEDYYSVTTSKHQCYVRNAIPTWAMVFSVGDNISDTGMLDVKDDYGFYGLPLFKATAVKYGWDNPIGEDSGRERKYDSQY